jgi:hypothetical protein
VMPRRHCDTQFLKQHPGAQGNAGPCPSSCCYRPRCYHLRRCCCRSHWLLLRHPGSTPRRWDADRIRFPPHLPATAAPASPPSCNWACISCPTSDYPQTSVFCRSTISIIQVPVKNGTCFTYYVRSNACLPIKHGTRSGFSKYRNPSSVWNSGGIRSECATSAIGRALAPIGIIRTCLPLFWGYISSSNH